MPAAPALRAIAPRPSVRAALERDDAIWLSSLRPDGRPHVVPIWFWWDGAALLVFSKPHAQKVRNVGGNPSVMIAVGEPGLDFDVELAEATAELLEPMGQLPPAFVHKYADRLVAAGVTAARFAEVYSQPIRLVPTRWLDWGGFGWIDREGHPATRHDRREAARGLAA